MDSESPLASPDVSSDSVGAAVALLGFALVGWFLLSYDFAGPQPPVAYARPLRHGVYVHLPLLAGLLALVVAGLLWLRE